VIRAPQWRNEVEACPEGHAAARSTGDKAIAISARPALEKIIACYSFLHSVPNWLVFYRRARSRVHLSF
jgi:hypothetical protein